MPPFRARSVPAYAIAAAAAAVLSACTWSRLSAEAPPGVRLAGDWKLDPAHSDDLGRAVEQLRAQEAKARRDQPQASSGGEGGPASGRRRARRGSPRSQQGGEVGQQDENPPGPEPGAGEAGAGLPRVSAVDELMSSVPRGEYLRITVGASTFTVASGASSDQYTPGIESAISAEQGEARQISGWKGGAYVIDTRPQWGPEIIQSYSLAKDGRLTLTVRLTGGRTNFLFTRVYDRTTRVSPLAPPTNN